MRGRPWEYVFYVDFLRGDDEPARNALRHLGEVAEFVKVLGIYPAALMGNGCSARVHGTQTALCRAISTPLCTLSHIAPVT